MSQVRVIAPSVSRSTVALMGNRSVTADPVSLVADIDAGDVSIPGANAWLVVGPVGPSSARPQGLAFAQRGQRFVDLTLGYEVLWTGSQWVNPASMSVV